ncbi:hypothetical protein [Pontibacillus salipaludis]|uniref:Uncharacterized protein n=1 Tax=Pontibacillus salipaludis TaxID=1697394 RepID=A0ABQ1Q5M8_9BACI|nr:hypothetical protein [Pontibacillus salipaludis]GGD13627.1 hypothetical protein GCM10011389_21560 [Pontibacillus salipaludis]
MRTLLELLRILFIFVILGGLGWVLIENIYTINEATEGYSWFGALAVFVLLFVVYRNKLQFFGWDEGEGRKKLSRNVSVTLLFTSIMLIITPFILGSLLS